jgi:hypothetical protein
VLHARKPALALLLVSMLTAACSAESSGSIDGTAGGSGSGGDGGAGGGPEPPPFEEFAWRTDTPDVRVERFCAEAAAPDDVADTTFIDCELEGATF